MAILASELLKTSLSITSLITDDTTTNATRYLTFTDTTNGEITGENVSSTKLYFNPSTGELSATNFNSLSDENFKENIETITHALEKTLKLRGVHYNLKDTSNRTIGLIAQEVERIIPEVISKNDNNVKSISYGNIIGLLIEAIKEQNAEIENLKKLIYFHINKSS